MSILCSDLPYARWLCEEEAVYFDPQSADSAWEAVEELRQRMAKGCRVDWSKALSKIPKGWEEVARRFLDLVTGGEITP